MVTSEATALICRLCGHANSGEVALVTRYGATESERVRYPECQSIPNCTARQRARQDEPEREDESTMVTQERPAGLNGTGQTNPNDPRHPQFLASARENLIAVTAEMTDAMRGRDGLRRQLAVHQRNLTDRSVELAADVCDELTPEGKLRYTNDAARKTETARRLRADGFAKGQDSQVNAIEAELSKVEVDFDQARRGRANLLALLDFSGRWLSYLGTHHEQEDQSR